ncbi:Uncharacterised protein [Chlamydia abortus]|nr:Uncharacterised protein [Chlamydia abortus]
MTCTGIPHPRISPYSRSRVVPSCELTIAKDRLHMRLKREDFPTLGLPKIAIRSMISSINLSFE